MIAVIVMALAGGLGAVARFVLDGWIKHLWQTRFPVGTLAINLLGSAALGALVGAHQAGTLSDGWLLVLGTGLLGGFTTMSTASVEVVRLLRLKATITGLGYLVGGALACVAAAWLGWWLTH